ncbi:MAG TPA: AraC family transcriptional regulator [Allosphingosinicella sp.]|nr:AraC family transcriptional regulator [Allosphingosinicella sp.]
MIAGCIEKMRRDACGGCERRDACAELFPSLFGARRERRPSSPASPFLSFLTQMARAVEESAREARPAPRGDRLRKQVEQRLEAVIESGEVGIERIARDLGYSRQTLYRRLKAEGITYEQLLDKLRRRLALRLIREQGLSVKEAAYRLGFSDPAAFSRAFKRWTGSSPGEMRTRH